jgi:hypothetical protein
MSFVEGWRMDVLGSVEGNSRTLRAWQLALLRYAVTLDYADHINVLAIAGEIDRGRRKASESAGFTFFRKISTDLCAAIARRDDSADALLRQYLAQIDDDRLKRAFAGVIEIDHQALPAKKPRKPRNDSALWRGLAAPGSARTGAR